MSKSTKDLDLGERLFVLAKGKPKSGKTIFSASFPDPYFLDADGRIAPVKKMFPDKDIPYDTYFEFNKLYARIEELDKYCPYGTVVLDGLTMTVKSMLSYLIDLRGRGGKSSTDKVQAQRFGVIKLPDIEDWNGEAQGISQMMDILRTLPCHVIVTAHIQYHTTTDIKTNITKTTSHVVTGAKKTASIFAGYFDEVYHFETEGGLGEMKYIFNTVGGGDSFAGTALPLERSIDFTDKSAFDIIQEQLKSHSIQLDKARHEAARFKSLKLPEEPKKP